MKNVEITYLRKPENGGVIAFYCPTCKRTDFSYSSHAAPPEEIASELNRWVGLTGYWRFVMYCENHARPEIADFLIMRKAEYVAYH